MGALPVVSQIVEEDEDFLKIPRVTQTAALNCQAARVIASPEVLVDFKVSPVGRFGERLKGRRVERSRDIRQDVLPKALRRGRVVRESPGPRPPGHPAQEHIPGCKIQAPPATCVTSNTVSTCRSGSVGRRGAALTRTRSKGWRRVRRTRKISDVSAEQSLEGACQRSTAHGVRRRLGSEGLASSDRRGTVSGGRRVLRVVGTASSRCRTRRSIGSIIGSSS